MVIEGLMQRLMRCYEYINDLHVSICSDNL